MTPTVVAAIESATDARCHATRCSDSGCSLSLQGAPNLRILLDLESEYSPVAAGQPHCDYLFIGGDGAAGPWVAPIELTTGRKRASEFLAQLAGGASVADRLLRRGIAFRFKPIAAHNGGLDPREVRNLRKPANRLRFRGKLEFVQLARCGSSLAGVLNA